MQGYCLRLCNWNWFVHYLWCLECRCSCFFHYTFIILCLLFLLLFYFLFLLQKMFEIWYKLALFIFWRQHTIDILFSWTIFLMFWVLLRFAYFYPWISIRGAFIFVFMNPLRLIIMFGSVIVSLKGLLIIELFLNLFGFVL